MTVRYVLKDGMQVGMLYMTEKGVHVVGGGDLVRFFKMKGGIKDNEFIVHPVDEEGDQFIELTRPLSSGREVESLVEKELNDHGYVLSPRRF